MNSVLKVTLLLGCSAAMTMVYAGGQVGVNNQGDGGVQAAIQFEHAKAAADARQASIESARAQQGLKPQTVSPTTQQVGVNHSGDGGVQAAIQFERAKAMADARQAQIQSRQAGDNAAVSGNADRLMTGHNK